jgi:hypothetical protein
MNEINPQTVIDELTRRLHQATLENVILTVQLREIQNSGSQLEEQDEETIIGDTIQE